jgi:hypothetical protein
MGEQREMKCALQATNKKNAFFYLLSQFRPVLLKSPEKKLEKKKTGRNWLEK